ncbi:MAG: FAD-dependent oxidoreductase, partial [Acidobacteria bacterium]|nr:FAD-dependent oxidoreductase [Acidobacteriota bacterium]
MSWNEYLINHARKTAGRRKRIYGIEPTPVVAGLLAREKTDLHLREAWRLITYVYLKSPKRRLKLFWRRLTDRDTPLRKQHIDLLAADLRASRSARGRIAINFFERRNCSKDLARVPPLIETMLFRTTPSLVVQPADEQDISNVLAYCKSKRLAVFPRGSASFAFGGAVPTRNGIVMDLSPMMAVLEVDPEEKTVRVQPGARWADVAAKLEPYGLIPMTTPTSRFSTVAGWISTGGMGLDSYGYGSVF